MELNSSYYRHIKWVGQDTSFKFTWTAYGETYKEIWDETVEHGINHWDTEFDYVMNQLGKTDEDYMVDGELDEDRQMDDYYEYKIHEMTDEEYRYLLETSKGNAYYSNFKFRNAETGEFE